MFENLMRKFVRFIDPKLEKYRRQKAKMSEKKYTPENLKDFIELIQRTPRSVLSEKDRARIAAVMSFDVRTVGDLMASQDEIVFVGKNEILGPLVLDKLYKSGFTNFPVVDEKEKVVGVIHTEALNALEIKKTDKAEKYMDNKVEYLHVDDKLKKVIEEIERTNSYYFLVRNSNEKLVGCFTIEMLMDYLLGKD